MNKVADNPYPGSRAFTQADRALFYGRGADTAMVADLWTANRLTVVSGPVGSGKTSLLRAGVYPSMREKPSRVLPVGDPFREPPTSFPFPAFPEHNPFTLALLRSWYPEEVPARLAGLSISDFVGRIAPGRQTVTYAAIDHLDDILLGQGPGAWPRWRRQFLAELTQAIEEHPRLHLLLATRDTAFDLLASSVGVGARHEVAALTASQAAEAITQPALATGLTFTDAAADRLIDDLGSGLPAGGRVEPSLLQAVCRWLWDALPPGVTEVSEWTVRDDADAALAACCGQVMDTVVALHDKLSFETLRTWLVTNFVTGGGIQAGGRGVTELPEAVCQELLDRHLLTIESAGSGRRYQLLTSRLAGPLRAARPRRLTPPAAEDYLREAGLLLVRGDLERARDYGELARRPRPGLSFRTSADAESLLGNVAYWCGKADETLEHYREAAELLQAVGDTRFAAYHHAAVGQILLAEDEPAEAVRELRAAFERDPSDLGMQLQLAIALWQADDGEAALSILDSVLARDGGHSEALRVRGEIRADLGAGRDAKRDLERAVPGRPSSRAALGLALAELGDHRGAAAAINGALAEARRSGPVLFYAARASDLAGDKVSAKERAREAVEATDPPLSHAHKRRARRFAGF